jgi:non-heme chloroperoxidase
MFKSLVSAAALGALAACQAPNLSQAQPIMTQGEQAMSFIKTRDGTNIFYKDWGPKHAQPIVFHHGLPLSSDDWDTQMLFFLQKGYRVIAMDRCGHGRSDQTYSGNNMDTYATDVFDLAEALDLQNAVHIGPSTGGGVVARYVAISAPGRVSKAVLLGAVTPIMAKTEANPDGIPIEVFDGFRDALVNNRAQFLLEIPSGSFYGFNREGAEVSEGLIRNWWRQGMAGGAKAQYDSIKAFSETDFTEDLKSIEQPVLVMHGEDDQIVPVDNTARRAIDLLQNGEIITYEGRSHGLFATHPDLVNADLLRFIEK